ncbi:hypothetical protein CU097_013937 [Rhizopus azygosporus]|uniref:Uncharacterized protein n=2 Tax=Rhizopus TaxID=4842 RepID=A0A367K7M1_RHIAZ|nr:hypothetical protein G6F69_001794 [Rhizopus microsporus]RCH98170.1 hypothetical protein CU097_013937 [Rhizopus azygosporus]KAG1238947.1 hypothetical protein G6F67_000045 [Rhizopus microsporus]KAG1267815.1 hypothetical protein G6F68_001620 [Rhizopus microsporus]ORE22705.1 hypothetical protein BCV71DRAFT_260011 [Rhizopus microsporus]
MYGLYRLKDDSNIHIIHNVDWNHCFVQVSDNEVNLKTINERIANYIYKRKDKATESFIKRQKAKQNVQQIVNSIASSLSDVAYGKELKLEHQLSSITLSILSTKEEFVALRAKIEEVRRQIEQEIRSGTVNQSATSTTTTTTFKEQESLKKFRQVYKHIYQINKAIDLATLSA